MRVTDVSNTASAIVASTGDAAFAIDSGGRIGAWNEAAERLLGYDESEVLGEACYALLAGRDIFGNCYCNPHCPLLAMAVRREAVGPFEISLRAASGQRLHTEVSVIALPDDGFAGTQVVHILQLVQEPVVFDGQGDEAARDRFGRLTPRESEVVRLMADGKGTKAMAEGLFIGEATVRHHVQSILRKLEVHSRLEAVALLHQTRSI
jgi:DNA-binding CsgD family transcriptional regulator